MIDRELVKKQIPLALSETNFSLGEKYKGKVRDNYTVGKRMIMITTDRISAFDHVLGTIPLKGQILNQMAVFWFQKTKDITKNHLLEVPDPNAMVVKKVKPYPVEVIVRGYITGSLWREYESGKRYAYGLQLPDGLKKNQKFSQLILTPSTKEQYGKHDTPISREEIIAQGLVAHQRYEEIERKALALYRRGVEVAARQGLILVDTKYEFGEDEDGSLVLMDEIHTPDSSRYWVAKPYGQLFAAGKEQEMLDKENIRDWLRQQGFSGEGKPPVLSEEIKIKMCLTYIDAYQKITGNTFVPYFGDVLQRIERNLRQKGYL